MKTAITTTAPTQIAMMNDLMQQAGQAAKKVKGLVGEKLQAQADEIDQRYQMLEARKAMLEEELESELTDNTIDDLLQFRETVAIGLNNPTFEDKRRWLEILQAKVTVTNGIAVVTCRLGGEGMKFDLFTGYQESTLLNQNQ